MARVQTLRNLLTLLLLAYYYELIGLVGAQSNPFISIQIGDSTLNGTIESVPSGRGQRLYYAFKGIPYAQAERWKVSKNYMLYCNTLFKLMH